MSVLIRKILEERFTIDEAIASSSITKEEASKPYHIIKYSKDSLGKYAHHHASYDDYDDATDELLKQKSKAKHSFGGHKIVNSKQLKPLVRLSESQEYSMIELDEELVSPVYTKLKSQAEDQSNTADESYRTSEHHYAAELHVTAAKHAKGEIRKQQHINKALYHFEAAKYC